MILGLGSDICDIRRIEAAIARHGERFIARVFTEVERAKAVNRENPGRDLCQAFRGEGGGSQGSRHRVSEWRVLFRPRCGEPAVGPANLADDGWGGGTACGDHACGNGGVGRIDDDR
jgi:4'-phosphopantetheinyl transferase superfamily